MGKGSGRRPAAVADTIVAENWQKAFQQTPEPSVKYCRKCGGTGLLMEYPDDGEPRVIPCDRC